MAGFTTMATSLNLQSFPIHINFNTGLNRIGFASDSVNDILNYLDDNPAVKVISIFSHFAASDNLAERTFTLQQLSLFKKISEQMIQGLHDVPLLHQCNTSGVLNFPEAHFDMIRVGLGLYGYGNDTVFDSSLKPVASLKSVILKVQQVASGESIGYNRSCKVSSDTLVASIPIGYGDGISRQYGNGNGYVTIKGKKAFILGNVCMDMIMVDVTGIECVAGDEVVIFDENIPAATLAGNVNSISYELITSVSSRVKRVVITS